MNEIPGLAVSIVNFNTSELLLALLEQLSETTSRALRQITVIDNASSDGSADMVAERFPHVKLIRNTHNRGFGAAHNQALETLTSPYWLILNTDVRLDPADLIAMIDFMERRPDCGISGCRLTGFDGAFQPSAGQLPFGLALLGWLFNLETLGIRSNLHRSDREYHEHGRRVDWISGACMLLRSELARRIGGFDERYFLYFEDIDLCYRARRIGYSTRINAEVVVQHLGGASSDDPRFDQWLGSLIGSIRFYERHRGMWPSRFVHGLTVLAVLARVAAFGATGRWEAARTYGRILQNLAGRTRVYPQRS
jgi:GT2 family glycosyltransferase